jgi:hypothetical protein
MIFIDISHITILFGVILVLAKNNIIVYYIDSERLGAPLTQAFAVLTDRTFLISVLFLIRVGKFFRMEYNITDKLPIILNKEKSVCPSISLPFVPNFLH